MNWLSFRLIAQICTKRFTCVDKKQLELWVKSWKYTFISHWKKFWLGVGLSSCMYILKWYTETVWVTSVHCDSIITRPSTGKKPRNNGPRYMYTCDRCSKSFTVFHICKQMPHPPSFGMGYQLVYLVLWL